MQEELLSVVHGVSDIIAQTSDLKKTLQMICKYVAEQMNAKFSAICLFDEKEQKLVVRAMHGVYLVELENYHPEENVSIKVFRESRVVNIPTISKYVTEESLQSNSFLQRVNSVLAVPLRIGGQTIGTMTLGRVSRQVFPAKLVALMEIVATTVSMFILNNHIMESDMDGRGKKIREKARALPAPGSLQELNGRPIVSGVCAGRAMLLANDDVLINQKIERANNKNEEYVLLDKAFLIAKESLKKVSSEVNEMLTEADSSIFEMHRMILEDPTLRQRICKYLDDGYTVYTAISLTYKEFESEYQKIEDEYLRERLRDIEDILLRLINSINPTDCQENSAPKTRKLQKIILVARELLPSQFISSPLRQVSGIICESGGATSHAAILARALRIPMLCGVSDILSKIHADDPLLLDCHAGICYLRPTATLLQQFKSPLAQSSKRRNAASAVESDEPIDENPKTSDGIEIGIRGNITLFSELPLLHNVGVESIGLYRTEFMFMIRNSMPDEDEQAKVLARLVEGAKGAQVTIRALDIGGDKPLPYMKWDNELNPSLGWRGLRFLLSNPDFLLPHLKAILRTTTKGNVRIMFPMVADKCDLIKAKQILEEAKRQLDRNGIQYKKPQFGMMLEVPSAVTDLENLLPEVDFISIGTNDLIQYLFAVDRGNSHVNKWYRQYHPIIFKTLRQICRTVEKFPGKEVSICGELGGCAKALPLLLGVGLRKFSMNAASITAFREYLHKVSIQECTELADNLSAFDSDKDIVKALDAFAEKKGIRFKDL